MSTTSLRVNRNYIVTGVFIFLISVITVTANAGSGATFVPLGDLHGGTFYSQAHAISGDGKVVVGRSIDHEGYQAFRWTAETGIESLGVLEGVDPRGVATDVSFDGSVVVGWNNFGFSTAAWRWTEETGMIGLGDFQGGGFFSKAHGVSADGSVVAGESQGETNVFAFRWTAETGMQNLGVFESSNPFSRANGISDDGNVVVGQSNIEDGTESFRWTAETGIQPLGTAPGGGLFEFNIAESASANGNFITGSTFTPDGVEVFRWSSLTGVMTLGLFPGGSSSGFAYHISPDGSVIVGEESLTEGSQAFIWDPDNGSRNLKSYLENDFGLDLTGWALTRATGISNDGNTITGNGINPDGNDEAFVVFLQDVVQFPDCNNNDIDDTVEMDTDQDGIIDDCDACFATLINSTVDESGRPLGDFDFDCDVDMKDFAMFQIQFGNNSNAITYEIMKNNFTGP